MLTFGLFVALLALVSSFEYDTATCRDKSLSGSTWPSDHGDSSRTKFTYGAGLPQELNPEEMKKIEQNGLNSPQWLYTQGANSEYVFAMGGTIFSTYVAKMDATTLEIIQKVTFKPALYIGGLLMHANGHVYGIQGNTLTVFWDGDLSNSNVLDLPTTGNLNGNTVQTNGMVVTSDGYLVVKQWSFILEDFGLYFYAVPLMFRALVAMVIGTALACAYGMTMGKNKRTLMTIALYAILGAALGAVVFFTLLMLLMYKLFGSYDPYPFVTTNLVFANQGNGGQLKIIDPVTLEVVADLSLKERCSFGRMALAGFQNNEGGEGEEEEEDAIVLIGDEFIRQYRWNPSTKRLYEIEEWAERYRHRGVGSFPGTGPAIFKGTAFFTDNTFPVMLWGNSYTLFRKDLRASSRVDNGALVPPTMTQVSLNAPGMSGFMFWSVVVSPVEGDVVVWDSAGRSVQARRAHDLSLRWNLTAVQGDCITIAADKGHVYLSDYSDGPADYSTWMAAVGPTSKSLYPGIQKFFIVADTATGQVLMNVTIMEGEGIKPALIVPGGNNDVLVAKANGLNRMYFDVDTETLSASAESQEDDDEGNDEGQLGEQ